MPLLVPTNLTPQNQQTSIGILFPFGETTTGGIIAPTRTTLQTIQSDLIAFLTTPIRGRVMNNNLFSPLPQFVFEQANEIALSQLQTDLTTKINQYFPAITVVDVGLVIDASTSILTVAITYSVPDLGLTNQSVQVNVQMAA